MEVRQRRRYGWTAVDEVMMLRLHERPVALVVGGYGTFGRAIVRELCDAGMDGFVFGRRAARRAATDLPFLDESRHLEGDATDAGAIEEAFAQTRPAAVIVCAGSAATCRPIAEQSWSAFSAQCDTDLRIAFNCVRTSLRLPLDPGSHVVVLSSGAMLRPHSLVAGYAAAKGAVVSLVRAAAPDAAVLGVRLQCVLPSLAGDTPVGAQALREFAQYAQCTVEELILQRHARPFVTPADVAHGVRTLVMSDEPTASSVVEISAAGMRSIPFPTA